MAETERLVYIIEVQDNASKVFQAIGKNLSEAAQQSGNFARELGSMVNVKVDGWFGQEVGGVKQHLDLADFRTIELRSGSG